jgi:hypothetical protein
MATLVGLTGVAWLVSYTTKQNTEVTESLSSNTLIFFVIGAVAIVTVMIYLVFIKEE